MNFKSLTFRLFRKFPLNIKKQLPTLVFSTLFLGFLEMLTISMIVPIITIFIKGDYNGVFSKLLEIDFLTDLPKEQLIFLMAILFFGIFIFKFFYSIWHAFYQSAYVYKIQKYIAGRLYNLRGFPLFQKASDASPQQLVHKIVNETSQLTIHFSVPLSIIFSELTTVLALTILMLTVDFLAGVIFLTTSIVCTAFFYHNIKKKVKNWGEERVYFEQKRSDLVMRGIYDGPQLNLLGIKSFFFNIFNDYNNNISNLLTLQRSYLLIPRFLIEFFSIISIFLCITIFFYLEKDPKDIFISISLITFIGMRIMPSLNKVSISLQEFRFANPLIKSLLKELNVGEQNMNKFVSYRDKGELYIARGFYRNREKKNFLNIKANANDTILITGPSGCGKSTLLKSMIGLDNKFKEVSFRKKIKSDFKIGFLSNSSSLFPLPLIDNVLLGRDIKKHELRFILDLCMLNEFDLLGRGGKKIIGKNGFQVSTGEKQRIVLARALVGFPDILVLDESLSALDKKNYLIIEKNLFKHYNGVLIHASHHYTNSDKYTIHVELK